MPIAVKYRGIVCSDTEISNSSCGNEVDRVSIFGHKWSTPYRTRRPVPGFWSISILPLGNLVNNLYTLRSLVMLPHALLKSGNVAATQYPYRTSCKITIQTSRRSIKSLHIFSVSIGFYIVCRLFRFTLKG
ncbi:hypothetical protein TNCT_217081 [Trichonephila clavata]|uniref:Uncharacterized protein n=1 Tax=Trichonephila clavata TaxID=2740835 RepID=A0A8X6HDQ3_TRICU|nr:hypothetical protein TNCT_217081 [Trichonephila clavata]